MNLEESDILENISTRVVSINKKFKRADYGVNHIMPMEKK